MGFKFYYGDLGLFCMVYSLWLELGLWDSYGSNFYYEVADLPEMGLYLDDDDPNDTGLNFIIFLTYCNAPFETCPKSFCSDLIFYTYGVVGLIRFSPITTLVYYKSIC